MTQTTVQTAEDLLRFKEPGKTAELLRGLLIVREPPDGEDILPGFRCPVRDILEL